MKKQILLILMILGANVYAMNTSTLTPQAINFNFIERTPGTQIFEHFVTEEGNKAYKELSDLQKQNIFNKIAIGNFCLSKTEQGAAMFWHVASKIIDPLEGISDLGITVMAACMNQEKIASSSVVSTMTFSFMLCKIIFKSMHSYVLKQAQDYKNVKTVLKAFELDNLYNKENALEAQNLTVQGNNAETSPVNNNLE